MGIIFDRLVVWLAEDLNHIVKTDEKPIRKSKQKPRTEKANCPNCGTDISYKDARTKFCSRRCAGMATAQKQWRERQEKNG